MKLRRTMNPTQFPRSSFITFARKNRSNLFTQPLVVRNQRPNHRPAPFCESLGKTTGQVIYAILGCIRNVPIAAFVRVPPSTSDGSHLSGKRVCRSSDWTTIAPCPADSVSNRLFNGGLQGRLFRARVNTAILALYLSRGKVRLSCFGVGNRCALESRVSAFGLSGYCRTMSCFIPVSSETSEIRG